ncbi:MAG: endonuclease III [Clostridia bacterium]|nr:endonuclease III [Clostridia bacterium]
MRRSKLNRIIELLEQEYPEVRCSLNWRTPLELLISTQLSAQCTDARVNLVTPALFERFPDAKAYAEADVTEIESYIHSTGLYKNKAKNIKLCCQQLLERHNGEVPDTMEAMTALAGTGRKTANLVLGELYGKPAYVVDTHVTRLCGLLGITKKKDPVQIERDLRKLIPPDGPNPEKALGLCHRLVYHGRKVCIARRPQCGECCLKEICPSSR